ncbi:unnamed protein product, partial [marine sediment metagenome]
DNVTIDTSSPLATFLSNIASSESALFPPDANDDEIYWAEFEDGSHV